MYLRTTICLFAGVKEFETVQLTVFFSPAVRNLEWTMHAASKQIVFRTDTPTIARAFVHVVLQVASGAGVKRFCF